MRKNEAGQIYTFMALQADGTAVTTGVTGQRVLDGGPPAGATAPIHIAGGWWRWTSSAADTNGDFVSLNFTGGSMVPVAMSFDTRNWWADMRELNGSGVDAEKLARSVEPIITAEVLVMTGSRDGMNVQNASETLAEDGIIGRTLVFTGGGASQSAVRITDYNVAGAQLFFDPPVPAIAAPGDPFVILPQSQGSQNVRAWADSTGAVKNGDTSGLPQMGVSAWQDRPLGNTNMIEDDGSNNDRWTTKALEQGPVATGFSTHSAADVWAVATRTITGGTVTTVTNPVTVGTNNDKTGYDIQFIDGKDVKNIPYISISGVPVNAPIPTSGTNVVQAKIAIQGFNRDLLDPDESPPGTYLLQAFAENDTGADRSSNLGTVTRRAQGDFTVDYTINSSHEAENIVISVVGTFDGLQYGELVSPPMSVGFDELALDNLVEPGVTVRQSHQIANAANAGILAGAGTATMTMRDRGNTKDRITATVDQNGNRTAVAVNLD